jgi:hypothetical protein
MGSLKFFRPNHGHEQIDKEQQGNDSNDDVPHRYLLEFIAKTDI